MLFMAVKWVHCSQLGAQTLGAGFHDAKLRSLQVFNDKMRKLCQAAVSLSCGYEWHW